MNRRIRSSHLQSHNRAEPYLRYLKPGALAQIRDSRFSARSRRIDLLPQIWAHSASPPSSNPSNGGRPEVNLIDVFPCFSPRIYVPRCPQRKKLVAAKAVLFSNASTSGLVSGSPDPIIDSMSSDNILTAH
ncbi:hypothetical protein HS088_TW10G00433 [Tripterygium wilfordii]|uniref:Uncharacterized protein n=1 Tax=Tripterygium wilfordii TaxID=458696 RepID=A0A7J7D5U8_TRIWF|nr:uncharacterized protein LOC120007231 [Tripterygium wilfordii]KAF5741436.1 hypothetical protein HS088_TW10G00433 [Tripterygium wilfordii]